MIIYLWNPFDSFHSSGISAHNNASQNVWLVCAEVESGRMTEIPCETCVRENESHDDFNRIFVMLWLVMVSANFNCTLNSTFFSPFDLWKKEMASLRRWNVKSFQMNHHAALSRRRRPQTLNHLNEPVVLVFWTMQNICFYCKLIRRKADKRRTHDCY